jgi:hypothetical protein
MALYLVLRAMATTRDSPVSAWIDARAVSCRRLWMACMEARPADQENSPSSANRKVERHLLHHGLL